ncbi:hypothetical protein BaRGS_00027617 [Batillaria attramentaria]|uniref:DUF4062 domain-containing protein n=1 Tax=Batillaria attramentaria TaxID=370345 RepID=A0ABD0K2A5_9CAEN
MEEEREELTKKYFPQIQHKCAEMGLQFVAVDMRWGITTEASDNAQTVNICLREIDRSDMFVCFFGQRYGWHQSAGHTDGLLQQNIDSALGKYPWLDNYRDRSVTELELLHGHLNNPGVLPSCVLFRDKQYDDAMLSVRKEKAVSYTIENDEAQEKLDNLKKKALALYFDYPNPLEGARLMFEEVMKYLENKVLTQNVEMSKREREFAPHKAFMASRTSQYAGKPEDFDTLDQKLKPPDSDQPQESPHMLVLGPAGSGKSALICNWLQERVAKQPDVLVVPYFIGCAPSTRNPEELLGFVYTELEYQLGDVSKGDKNTDSGKDYGDCTGDTTKPPEKPESSGEGDRSKTPHAIPNGDGAAKDSKSSSDSSDGVKAKEPARPKGKELQRAILKQLERAVETGKTVLLVFDAVNRLVAPSKTSKHLYWLPEKLPQGVVCVVATDETDQATLDILLTQRKYSTLKLLPLDEAVQRDICVQTLNHSGKELSEQQLSTITKAQQTANPLFLKTVLAELSIFGSFRQLDSKIKSLISVASIKELLHNCLERLEADYNVKEYNGNLVGEILAALEVSREGLTETQIMNIFNIHSHTWSPLCFAMEYFTISHRGKLG